MNLFPQLNFIYSRPYLKLFFKLLKIEKPHYGFENFFKEILEEGKKFELMFQNYQTEIFKLISKYSGYEWLLKDTFLNVYPVKGTPSFSHPLTLSLKSDFNVTIGILIHELAHINIKIDLKNDELQESIMNTISITILSDLSLEGENYKNFASTIFQKRFSHEFSNNLNLRETTVKNYLLNSFN